MMDSFTTLIMIILSSVLVNNYVLAQFMGICPFLGVSKKLDQASGMGVAVTAVMLLATAATWPIQYFVLQPLGLEYLRIILFILIIASLVQLLELLLKKYIPALHKGLGVYLPLITTNCAVLGIALDNVKYNFSFLQSMISSLGVGLGFLLAMVLFSGLRSRIDETQIPKPFRGLASTLIAASFISLAFMGFSGMGKEIKLEPIAGKNALDFLLTGNQTTDILIGILLALVVCGAIALLLDLVLSFASRFLAVEEDQKVKQVRACLPGVNCGACGYKGCDDYAAAVAEGSAKPNLCVPGAEATAAELGAILGVEVEAPEDLVAYVHCNGHCEATGKKAAYDGISTCRAASMLFAGPDACRHGCVGLGDCAAACPSGAICLKDGIAHVDTSLCIGCGLCRDTCPKHIISMIPQESAVVVACSNTDKGAQARTVCKNACIACKKCEKACAFGAVSVKDNLAGIDYDKCTGCGACADACPTGAIKKVVLADIPEDVNPRDLVK